MNDALPPPRTAAERILCLMAVGARAYFEGEFHVQKSEEGAVASVQLLNEWLVGETLWKKLSRAELVLMGKPAGGWTERERLSGGWRPESAGIIAWSLGLLAMPPYDTTFRPGHILDVIPERGNSTGDWIGQAQYRPGDEIAEARDVAELWLWRAGVETHLRNHDPPDSRVGRSWEELISDSARNQEQEGWFQAIDSDYPAKGKPYARLTESEWWLMRSIAHERLYGLNWLCDEEKDWDLVALDT